MTDIPTIVAELRTPELVAILRSAVDGERGWRDKAKRLLRSIDRGEVPQAETDPRPLAGYAAPWMLRGQEGGR